MKYDNFSTDDEEINPLDVFQPYIDDTQSMSQRTVQIKKSELLKTLLENKKSHLEAFDEASKEWASDMESAVTALSKNPTDETLISSLTRKAASKPVEYSEHYDSAIKQMEMEQRDMIELDLTEFNQLCCDEWSWSRNFASNVYTSATIRKK